MTKHTKQRVRNPLMDIRKIKKLIELVEESGISELEISEGEESDAVTSGRATPDTNGTHPQTRLRSVSVGRAGRVISSVVP